MDNSIVQKKQYERIRYLCYQLIHFQSDLENEFLIKSDCDKEIFESLKGLYQTLQNDAFVAAEKMSEILNADDNIKQEVI